jgi:hypothetical protein
MKLAGWWPLAALSNTTGGKVKTYLVFAIGAASRAGQQSIRCRPGGRLVNFLRWRLYPHARS